MIDVTMNIVKTLTDAPKRAQLAELWYNDKFRLVQVNYTDFLMDDLKGDTFNPEVNGECPEILARQEEEFEERVYSEGVHGLMGQLKQGQEWVTIDSCFGFVGTDYVGSGYDMDILNATIEALK